MKKKYGLITALQRLHPLYTGHISRNRGTERKDKCRSMKIKQSLSLPMSLFPFLSSFSVIILPLVLFLTTRFALLAVRHKDKMNGVWFRAGGNFGYCSIPPVDMYLPSKPCWELCNHTRQNSTLSLLSAPQHYDTIYSIIHLLSLH